MEDECPRRPSKRVSVTALRLPVQQSRGRTEQDAFVSKVCDYLDHHRIWDLFASLTESLAIDKPADPISYLIDELKYPRSILKVVVIGGSRAGKSSMCASIARDFNTELVIVSDLVQHESMTDSEAGATIQACRERNDPIPADLMATILKRTLASSKCKKRGWILDGFPATRRQGEAMLRAGVLPNKVLVLDRGVIDSETNNALDLFKHDSCVIGDVTLPVAWQRARDYLAIPEPSRAPKRTRPVQT